MILGCVIVGRCTCLPPHYPSEGHWIETPRPCSSVCLPPLRRVPLCLRLHTVGMDELNDGLEFFFDKTTTLIRGNSFVPYHRRSYFRLDLDGAAEMYHCYCLDAGLNPVAAPGTCCRKMLWRSPNYGHAAAGLC